MPRTPVRDDLTPFRYPDAGVIASMVGPDKRGQGLILLRLQGRFDEGEPVVAPEHLFTYEEGRGPKDAPLNRL